MMPQLPRPSHSCSFLPSSPHHIKPSCITSANLLATMVSRAISNFLNQGIKNVINGMNQVQLLLQRQRRVWLVGIGRCLVVDALHVLHAVSKMNTFEPNADRREIFNFRAPAVTKSFRLISDKDMGGIFGELCMLLHQQPIVDWSVLVASRLHNSRVYARSSCRVCNLERPARYHSTKSKDGQEWLCCHHLTGMIRSLYCLS
jgi:hypothetical protein